MGEGANLGLGDAHGERRGRATSSVGLTVSHSDEAPSGILPRMGQFLPRAEASSIWPRVESINIYRRRSVQTVYAKKEMGMA